MRIWFWKRHAASDPPPRRISAEEEGELYLLSLEMHYGDEPLYFSDPPEWPQHGDTVGVLQEEKDA